MTILVLHQAVPPIFYNKIAPMLEITPYQKNFSMERHDIFPTNKHVKFPHLCKKWFSITPSGYTVRQHQCGERWSANRRTVIRLCMVFCQTFTKPCQFHCQMTNNALQAMLPKFC